MQTHRWRRGKTSGEKRAAWWRQKSTMRKNGKGTGVVKITGGVSPEFRARMARQGITLVEVKADAR